jgi:6-phosphogluconolactonase (cycloisomerase 2 family)
MDGSFVRSRLPVLTLALLARATWRSAGSRLRATARWLSLSALFGCSVMLGACGGGGSGDADATPPPSGGAVGGVTTPVVTTQPTSQAVALGSSITFTVTATGNGLAYQWQRSTTGGVSWQDIGGATSQSLTVSAIDVTMNGYQYHVIVGNVAGMVVSDAATLTVASAGSGGGTGGGSGGSGTGQHFLYATNAGGNTIEGFAVDAASGALASTPGSPYLSDRSSVLTLHPSGNFLYATVLGASTGTWVYRIDSSSGALALVPGSPYATDFTPTAFPSIDSSGKYFVTRQGIGIAVYSINQGTGALSPVAGSPIIAAVSSEIAFSADSRYIYVRGSNENLQALTLDPLAHVPGSPTSIKVSGSQPVYFRDGFLLAVLTDRTLASIAVNAGTGALSVSQVVQTGAPTDAIQLVAHPNGHCFLLNRWSSSSSQTIQPLEFTSGAVTLKTPTLQVSTSQTSTWLGLDPLGAFGYVSGYGGLPGSVFLGPVTPLEINGTQCSVSIGSAGRFIIDPAEVAIFNNTGSLAFTFNAPVAGINVRRIDPVTRTPSLVTGSPFPMQAFPSSIVFR